MSTRILALLALLAFSGACQRGDTWEPESSSGSGFGNLVSNFAAQQLAGPLSLLPGNFDPCSTPGTPDDAVGYGGSDAGTACAPSEGDTPCEECAKSACCIPSLDCWMSAACACLTACDSAAAAACPASTRAACGLPDPYYAAESLCLASRCATACAPGAR